MSTTRYRVLVVDDEAPIRRALVRQLGASYDVTAADGAEAALRLLDEQPFDAIISDMHMPGMDGIALIREAATKHPDQIRVLVSGRPNDIMHDTAVEVGAYKLKKPWGDELLFILRNALEQRRQLRSMREDLAKGLERIVAPSPGARELGDILQTLKTSLAGLPSVSFVQVRLIPAPPQLDAEDPMAFCLPSIPTMLEATNELELSGVLPDGEGGGVDIAVRWLAADVLAARMVEVALRDAYDALRLRQMAQSLREHKAQLGIANRELAQRDHVVVLGMVAAAVAGEMKTPLTVLVANQNYIEARLNLEETTEVNTDVRSAIAEASSAAEVIDALVQSVRILASREDPQGQSRVTDALEVVLRLLRPLLSRDRVRIEVLVDPDTRVGTSTADLAQILTALIFYLARTAEAYSVIRVSVEAEGDEVRLGIGSPALLDCLEPIELIPISPKRVTGSTHDALGLATARDTVARYGGTLQALQLGTIKVGAFRVALPSTPPSFSFKSNGIIQRENGGETLDPRSV